jgi:glutaminyl-tRNA synthetase
MDEHDRRQSAPGKDFIRQIIDGHREEGRYDRIVTRFPPEPNGYLHIGHAKSICLNFGLAREYGGTCHLRFDDTNPLTEDEEYTSSIQRDVRWLGFDWGENLFFASDYFERMYEVAEGLIRAGKAYVDSSSEEEIRAARGTVTEPGYPTAYRDRSAEENLDLFRRMRAGEFEDGAHVLRAKIDLASPNMIMRDPVLYRIRHAHHYRTGDDWCIYPLYDFAHCLEDAFEGISHSLCTLEFDNNREIYDWILDEAGFEEPRTHQYEFARLELDYTVLSKRKLIQLVRERLVSGWDDPRLPTIAGLRRRGVPPEAIRRFCDMVGVAKSNSVVDMGKLEFAIREALDPVVPRALAVVEPLKVVVTNWESDRVEQLEAPFHPNAPADADRPTRELAMTRELWIEAGDFAQEPPRGWKRLSPGGEVRLRYGYVVRCDEVITGDDGAVVELRCTVDGDTLGTNPDRKIGGTIHWLSAATAVPAEFRLYERLFDAASPNDVPEDGDFTDNLNPESLVVRRGFVEPSLARGSEGVPALSPPAEAPWEGRVQLERLGFFTRDADFAPDAPVFNRIVTLRDSWGRKAKAAAGDTGTVRSSDGGGSLGERKTSGAGKASPPQPAAQPRVSEARNAVRAEDPELAARFARYQSELGVSELDADVLTGSRRISDLFEGALAVHGDAAEVTVWMVNEVAALLKDDEGTALEGAAVGTLLGRVAEDAVSRSGAKEVLAELAEKGGDPDAIIRDRGLAKVTDPGALAPVVDEVLAEFADKVEAYRGGAKNLFGLFMGQVMRRSGGTADPAVVRELLSARLEG